MDTKLRAVMAALTNKPIFEDEDDGREKPLPRKND